MSRDYEIINGELIVVKPWMNMCLIENSCALGLGKDEVKEETESKPCIERYPKKAELLDGIVMCSSREGNVCEPN